MSVAKQLYQLQEIDLEIESAERSLTEKVSRLGEDMAVVEARNRLGAEQHLLDELKKQQRSLEWDIDAIMNRARAAEEQLYSGRINNPKELSNLQHEVEMLKTNRDHLENKALEIMGQAELAESSTSVTGKELERIEEDWHLQQQQLSVEIEQLKARMSDLKERRQQLSGGIEGQSLELYERLRKNKGQALARVEQGICRGCRISLPSSDLQQAKSGKAVQCSSCGRILFLP